MAAHKAATCTRSRRMICGDPNLKGVAMSYADPQAVTISGTTVSMPRTGSGASSGEFTSSDGTTQLAVSSTNGKRQRRVIRLTSNKITSDPLVANQNQRVRMMTYLVVDTPVNGYTVAEAKAVVDGLVAYLAASSGARVSQLLGGEN
ncbi:TPA_asm: coat protein [ssRNA phage Zoerhiza.1_30]|uniref:Coat protein n=2 Tax=Leviviricetes TaxID=2842243 RepID=A0A8S5L447_9VIRU|nr:coat protein [ssRNA phage Zoerhiza.1_30]QDH90591.1 MAG: hypothetical protein H1Rhizo26FD590_000002 [Leviviridae sp.]DAD52188.1 TPA_asm: coat protein [ssRNA phage Zoerhiza.1_30]